MAPEAGDASGITRVMMGGAEIQVPQREIRDAGYVQGKSAMPALARALTDEQVAGLVNYLRSLP